MKLVTFVIATCPLLIVAGDAAADLHPIIEVQNGYLFGAIADGKWIKADEAAKSMSDEMTYRVYGLTESLGEAKGGKPKYEEVPREEALSDALSPKPAH